MAGEDGGPRRNRVLPTGEIVAEPMRGLLMGNRGGALHDREGRLGQRCWRGTAWICCRLQWRGQRRRLLAPERYTELFFLDEATALAAGHRPCATCRRPEFIAFAEAWRRAHGLAVRPRAAEIDHALHAERVDPATRGQRRHHLPENGLADGIMLREPAGRILLVLADRLLPWTSEGYLTARHGDPPAGSLMLTPPAVARALAAGYRPGLHPSALHAAGTCCPG